MSSLEGRIARALNIAQPPTRRIEAPERPLNVVEFSHRFLGQSLYPRQGTLLKLITADRDALTDFDLQVIAEWAHGFAPAGDEARWVGTGGVPPDILTRVDRLAQADLPWFRSVVLVLGRRAGKGYVVRTLLAWRVWHLITSGDPHGHYGIDPLKQLNLLVFSTKVDQAKRDQFGDAHALLTTAPCFQRRLGRCTREVVTILTSAQLADGAQVGVDEGLIAVRAAESTSTAGRGAAVPMLVLDEVAHLSGAGSTSDANTIYDATMPAAAQFGPEQLVVLSSSPAEKTGPQYAAYQRALEVNPATGEGAYPDTFMLQGPSWCLYTDWRRAPEIPMWPGGPSFPPFKRAILEPTDDEVVLMRHSNPDTYAVEYAGQFRSARNNYLPPDRVDAMFHPFDGRTLVQETEGILNRTYMAHGDPSVSGANFGLAVGHGEWHGGRLHVLLDRLHHWEPSQFEGGRIDYDAIEDDLVGFAAAFGLSSLTFDQYNSAQVIQRLDRRIKALRLPKACHVGEATASSGANWRVAEVFKTALGMGIVHAPAYPLAQLELEYLQRTNNRIHPPSTGEVRTKDVADAIMQVTYAVIADGDPELFEALGGLSPSGSQPGGIPPRPLSRDEEVFQSFSNVHRRTARPFVERPNRRRNPGRWGR